MHAGELPRGALLARYKQEGAYTDCYFVDLPRSVSHAEYVEAFYTTALFKAERLILALAARRRSSDVDAKRLAAGGTSQFAAWSVEERTPNQLLLCDFLGQTRSWLMTAPVEGASPVTTRLYFGSAFVPRRDRASGRTSFGPSFHMLKGFHRLYSRALLSAACARLSPFARHSGRTP